MHHYIDIVAQRTRLDNLYRKIVSFCPFDLLNVIEFHSVIVYIVTSLQRFSNSLIAQSL